MLARALDSAQLLDGRLLFVVWHQGFSGEINLSKPHSGFSFCSLFYFKETGIYWREASRGSEDAEHLCGAEMLGETTASQSRVPVFPAVTLEPGVYFWGGNVILPLWRI